MAEQYENNVIQERDEKQEPQIEWAPITTPDKLWNELWRIKLEFGFVLHGTDQTPNIKLLACCARCNEVFNRSEDGESFSCSCGRKVGRKAMEVAKEKVHAFLS